MNDELVLLSWTGLHVTPWKLIGYSGALLFGGRWLVQFWATRRAGYPMIPRLFWIMSVLGSTLTLSYFSFSAKQDSVGVMQNVFPMFAACYSLWLDIRQGQRAAVFRAVSNPAARPNGADRWQAESQSG